MTDRASLELTLGSPPKARRKPPEEPLRMLFMADLSGPDSAGPSFKTYRVSFETFATTIAALAPEVPVALEAPLAINETLTIGSIEDFHPDSLARSLSALRTLAILGDRLGNPGTREEALAQLGELLGTGVPAEPQQEPVAPSEGEGDMMERLLGATAGASHRSRAQEKVESFVRSVMDEAHIEKPSVTAEVGRQQVDGLMAATMRAVLALQSFRSLERSWRSVEWLMQRLDDEAVEIHVVDLSKAKLSQHLSEHAEHLDRSDLHQLICAPASGNQWDLLLGDYSFALDADDMLLLTTLGAVAGTAGVPFLAHGELDLCGCQSREQLDSPWDWQLPDGELGELWAQVRSHPASRWVGLATPRILLRQPYGRGTDPIESFDFQELLPRPESEHFVWGNPAIGCAYVLGRAHAEERDFTATADLEVEDLPAALYDDGTGQALQPPVEALIGERAMNQIQAAGLIPMLGRRDSNTVRCADLTAVSSTVIRFIS